MSKTDSHFGRSVNMSLGQFLNRPSVTKELTHFIRFSERYCNERLSLHIRPGCDHHFFGNAMDTPPMPFYVFWGANSESDIENFEFEKL